MTGGAWGGRSTLVLLLVTAACGGASGRPDDAARPLVIIAGQSNAVGGAAVTDISDPALEAEYSRADPAVHIDMQIALNQATPIEWIYFSGDLQPRDGSGLRMGAELSLARTMVDGSLIGQFAVSGTSLARRWHPDATYPSDPPDSPNLYAQFIAYIEALEADRGMEATAIVWIQGNADAADLTTAEVYGENLQTFLDTIRADLARPIRFAFDELPTIDAPYASVVRGRQAAFAEANADNGVVMVHTGDLALRDGDHYTADSFITLGQRFGAAL